MVAHVFVNKFSLLKDFWDISWRNFANLNLICHSDDERSDKEESALATSLCELSQKADSSLALRASSE